MKRIPYRRSWLGRIWDRVFLFLLARFFAVVIAFTLGKRGERMSHNNGIGARGTFTANPAPEVPPISFFSPGKVFPCRIRHAMATFYDDAMAAIRSCSIKLADAHYESPFDLQCNTGSVGLFWSAASFLKLATLRQERYGVEYEKFYKKYPAGKRGAIATLRRNATSFSNLIYYNKTPQFFIGDDGVKRYAKYRIVPFEPQEETGTVFGTNDELDPSNQRILPGETKTRNYLKEEFESRLKHVGPVKYRLQAQIREHKDDQDEIIFNCCVDWPEEEFPSPKELSILPSKSIYDYNSVNYMRAHAGFAYKTRLLRYRLFGMLPEIPDNDNRNSSTII
jgi:arachidonate 5-lipoxygenase